MIWGNSIFYLIWGVHVLSSGAHIPHADFQSVGSRLRFWGEGRYALTWGGQGLGFWAYRVYRAFKICNGNSVYWVCTLYVVQGFFLALDKALEISNDCCGIPCKAPYGAYRTSDILAGGPTWTPKVCRIIACWAVFLGVRAIILHTLGA